MSFLHSEYLKTLTDQQIVDIIHKPESKKDEDLAWREFYLRKKDFAKRILFSRFDAKANDRWDEAIHNAFASFYRTIKLKKPEYSDNYFAQAVKGGYYRVAEERRRYLAGHESLEWKIYEAGKKLNPKDPYDEDIPIEDLARESGLSYEEIAIVKENSRVEINSFDTEDKNEDLIDPYTPSPEQEMINKESAQDDFCVEEFAKKHFGIEKLRDWEAEFLENLWGGMSITQAAQNANKSPQTGWTFTNKLRTIQLKSAGLNERIRAAADETAVSFLEKHRGFIHQTLDLLLEGKNHKEIQRQLGIKDQGSTRMLIKNLFTINPDLIEKHDKEIWEKLRDLKEKEHREAQEELASFSRALDLLMQGKSASEVERIQGRTRCTLLVNLKKLHQKKFDQLPDDLREKIPAFFQAKTAAGKV